MKKSHIALFISLGFHGILLFVTKSHNDVNKDEVKVMAQEERAAIDSNVIKIAIRIREDLPEPSKKAVIKKKKIVKLLKKKTVKSKQVAKPKRNESRGKQELVAYIEELRRHIEKRKSYPRKARRLKQSGLVEIDIEIDHLGNFIDIKLKKASEFKSLNMAALKLVQQISQFRPLPEDLGSKLVLSVPLKYQFRK